MLKGKIGRSAFSGANKIKRLGARISRKDRDLRFNNNHTALILVLFIKEKNRDLISK